MARRKRCSAVKFLLKSHIGITWSNQYSTANWTGYDYICLENSTACDIIMSDIKLTRT